MRISKLLTCLALCVLVWSCVSCGGPRELYCAREVIGYYPDWEGWTFPIGDIRFGDYTDIVYFSLAPNADGSLDTSQIDMERQALLVETAGAEGVDVHICIGGWGLSGGFSPMAGSASARTAFAANTVQYCMAHGFAGVVLDWEPVWDAADRANYTVLIQELKAGLSGYGLELSVAVAALGHEFDAAAIPYIDRLQVMAYDMGTPHSSYEDAVAALEHWRGFGFGAQKIVLGVPFYGRDTEAEPGYYPYRQIVETYHPWPEVDEVNGINYNGVDTIEAKTRRVLENGYAGVMVWELTLDTADETSLLSAIRDTLILEGPADFNCDGRVDLLDFDYLAQRWLSFGCSEANMWCGYADRQGSGAVDLRDYAEAMRW